MDNPRVFFAAFGQVFFLLLLTNALSAQDAPPALEPEAPTIVRPANTPRSERPHRGVLIRPHEIIAPVGTEVLLAAGVCDENSRLMAGEPIHWILSKDGVGEFVEIGNRDAWFEFPKKINNHYARGTTARYNYRLTKGTPSPNDDVNILRGMAWVTVTSPVQGTSFVTAYGPDVKAWDRRKETSVVHWVDARWDLPPAAANPSGTLHKLTTVVTRASDGEPLAGWSVRYSILDGPEAGLGPNRVPMLELPTDAFGQASVDMAQTAPGQGTNRIRVQIIRPVDRTRGYDRRLVVGSGVTTKTWTSPELTLSKTGPAQSPVGMPVKYQIEVTNNGQVNAANVEVFDQIPEIMSFVEAFPQPQTRGRQLRWQLGNLGPNERRTIELTLRADSPGSTQNCAIARAEPNFEARDCAPTTITTAQLKLEVTGPKEIQVGQQVSYEITIANQGDATATGLVIRDAFSPGLEHSTLQNPIERELGQLGPGQSRIIGVTFLVREEGELCQNLTLTGDGGLRAETQFCSNSVAAPPEPEPKLKVTKTGPTTRFVGQTARFLMLVKNEGDRAAQNIDVTDQWDTEFLQAQNATSGYRISEPGLISWRIPELPPGEELGFEIVFRCEKVAAEVCNRFTAEAVGVETARDQACFEIRRLPPPRLEVRMSEINDPIRVGQLTGYRVTIRNTGELDAQGVQLSVDIPPEMIFVSTGQFNDSQIEQETARRILFSPVNTIEPGESIRYQVNFRGTRVSRAVVQAAVTANGLAEPVIVEEETDITR